MRGPLRLAAVAAFCCAFAAPRLPSAGGPGPGGRVRIAVSGEFLGQVNENDAKAAMSAWAAALARSGEMEIDVSRPIVVPSAALLQMIRKGETDSFGVTTMEYFRVAAWTDPDLLMVDESAARDGTQYILLVHEDAGLASLRDLRGRGLIVYKSVTTCLADAWLGTLLAGLNLGPAQGHFGPISRDVKLSGVVLPVYFRKADACVTTRQSFETMCELNPQLGRKLRVLATSPKLQTGGLAFHRDCPPLRKKQMLAVLLGLHETVAGQQALTLFQGKRLVVADQSLFRSSIDLLAAYGRLRNQAGAARR